MDSGEEKELKEINCSVYLDRFEELEDGTAEAVLLLDEGGEEYSGELVLPADLIPADAGEGDYLTIKIFRDTDKTNAALEEARRLLQESED